MKLKSITMGCLLTLCSAVYATNIHVHPKDDSNQQAQSAVQMKYAGYCQIEIINQSYDDIRVNGVFDDGSPLAPFTIYSFEAPSYISLFYYGYCHYGMDLYIDSYNGYNLYSGFTRRESTIRLVPYLKGKATANLTQR